MMQKWIYEFEEGSKEMKALLGGKGANLAEMKKIGLPVPDGFTLTTEACNAYHERGGKFHEGLEEDIEKHIEKLEKKMNKGFGDPENPLLVSVRSGAYFSMPGMMDTVLNLGLNAETVEALARLTENPRFAYDCYRRFVQMFGDVVLEVPKHLFDRSMDAMKKKKGVEEDTDLDEHDLLELTEQFKAIIKQEKKMEFPENPKKQLLMTIEAVFDSWNNDRARIYRDLNEIPHNLGTAVNVQSMVFGNMGDTSGTGVAFTRNPSNGEQELFGEFLMNAQGEDVVAGIRTPRKMIELKDILPDVYQKFLDVCEKLEKHYKDMQDIEFTVENGSLYLLQTRTGKRTALASVKIAVDMVKSEMLTKEEAVMRVSPTQLDQLLHPMFSPEAMACASIIGKGLPASPGAAVGHIYFHSDDAVKAKARGENVILVRTETSPEDIEGMVSSKGILTSRGGMTSHAAVVARGMGKCCVAGCSSIHVDEEKRELHANEKTYYEGDLISLDGVSGSIFEGALPTVEVGMTEDFKQILMWADEFRKLGVRANADTPHDASVSVDFGAEGIGLCRTEHMFFDHERIKNVREMILSNTLEERQKALQKLLPCQREDFVGIFKAMGSRPVTIRLLDPPLHEFLPNKKEDIEVIARDLGMSYDRVQHIIDGLHEFNPMLGHRGCRLAITYPEIYNMQVRAIAEAVIECQKNHHIHVHPEIMIPLVGHVLEFETLQKDALEVIKQVCQEQKEDFEFKIGTMIEVPRAAFVSDQIAQTADFFSFGTNDLTQMTMGFSRDDAGKFLDQYLTHGIFEKDPFQTIDREGVGELVRISCEKGRHVKAGLKIGICGEHGGDPKSIEFCHEVGLDYVSCSPFRVPIARLAAAQVAIEERTGGLISKKDQR